MLSSCWCSCTKPGSNPVT